MFKRLNIISPYISEGSGLKHDSVMGRKILADISPYISEGSGLKLSIEAIADPVKKSPLTSVRGAD